MTTDSDYVYTYGSPPPPPYSYKDFVRHLAPVLPADDEAFKCAGSFAWRQNPALVTKEFFRSLCHWKSARRQDQTRHEDNNGKIESTIREAVIKLQLPPADKSTGDTVLDEAAIKRAVKILCELRGVDVRTASVVLTAWCPQVFGVMDFKVVRVLKLKESFTPRSYCAFLKHLRSLRKDLQLECSLRQVELATWHYYAVSYMGQRTIRG